MNKTTKGILIGFGIFLVIFVAIAMLTPTEEPKTEINREARIELKNDYMAGCMEEGGEDAYNFCDCSFDELMEMLGYDGIVKQSIDYATTGNFSDEMLRAVANCIGEI